MLIPTTIVQSSGGGSLSRIDVQALGADAGSVTFSSIPASYEHLMIVWTARGTDGGNPNINMQFNGDTGANYDRELVIGVGATVTSAPDIAQASITIAGAMPGSGAAAGAAASGRITIMSYARTTFHKSAVCDFSDLRGTVSSDALAGLTGGRWRNTAAITSVNLFPSASNFLAGSVFSLYGLT